MYQLVIFVPESHKEQLKKALFISGAGRSGHYDCACFESKGRGEFRPLKGSHPYIGSEEETTYVQEVRLEMICDDQYLKDVLLALRKHHPYEEPAFFVVKLEDYTF